MPTFSAMTLDRFFEPGSRKPPSKPTPPAPAMLERASSESKKTVSRLQASPALYAIPVAAPPLPDSPSSFSPSPYVVNHKRRGPRLFRNSSTGDSGDGSLLNDSQKVEAAAAAANGSLGICAQNGPVHKEPEVEAAQNGSDTMIHEDESIGDGPAMCDEPEEHSSDDVEKDGDNEDFFDLQDSMSIASNTELEEVGGLERLLNQNTPLGEYYDAMEEISNEVALSSYRKMEAALHQMKLNLSAEIEKRKQAEEASEKLRSHWQKLSHGLLSNLGMNLPAMVEEQMDGLPIVDPVDEFCHQLIVTRVVSAAVERGCCRAEIEQEMEPQVEAKNFEISRLKDRLQYYEAANKEMSQRNQETVEIARQERLKRKRRRKWLWGAAGLVVTLGVAASLTWPHLPSSSSKPASLVETDCSGGHENS